MDYYSSHGFPNFSEGFESNRFDRIPAERHRAISQKGGIASGKTRLRKAALRDYAMNMLENQALAQSATDEFYAAVNKVMRAERKKRRRRKSRVDE